MKPFKIQLVQELKPQRRIFGEDPLFFLSKKCVFSDEANLWLNGYLKKQNSLFCSEDQSEEL